MLNNITKKAAFVILSAAALTITSCKKEKSSIVVPVTPADHQLAKVEQDAAHYATFEYNADNLVSKAVNKSGVTVLNTDVTYNANKTVATATLNLTTLKFIYTNNALSKVEYHDQAGNDKLTFYTEFTNQNNKPVESKGYAVYQTTPSPDYKIVYTYNAAGDVITAKQYLWSPNNNNYFATETTTYEYDNKVNPLYALGNVGFMLFNVTSAHNITKEVVRDALDQITETSIYTYTYDAKGYPLTGTQKTTTQENPNEVTTQLKFSYKN